jgi:hypothetical protein
VRPRPTAPKPSASLVEAQKIVAFRHGPTCTQGYLEIRMNNLHIAGSRIQRTCSEISAPALTSAVKVDPAFFASKRFPCGALRVHSLGLARHHVGPKRLDLVGGEQIAPRRHLVLAARY